LAAKKVRIGSGRSLWARRGTRPIQPADQRYESAYLSGAICPARGVGAALATPFADTDAMQRHLDEIALHVARNAHAVLRLAPRRMAHHCQSGLAEKPHADLAAVALAGAQSGRAGLQYLRANSLSKPRL
jgi:hypothetical protein